MKRSLIFILFIFFATPCLAQWRNIGAGNPNGGDLSDSTIAIGVLDTSVFESVVPLNNVGPLIWRFVDSGNWVPAAGGIDRIGPLGVNSITTFASVGPNLFAGSGPPNEGNGYLLTNVDSSWSIIIGGPVGTNGTYVFGSYGAGIARSRDGGQTWEHFPADAGNYYAGSGACVFSSSPYGAWHSIDSGSTWSRDTLPAGISLSAFASFGSHLYAGGDGVSLSMDSGQTWTPISLKNRIVSALATYKTYLFAGTDSGIFISSDSGMNWRDVSDNMGAAPTRFPNVKLLALLDTMLFASVEAGVNPNNGWDYGYTTDRPISEMTSTSGVVQTELPGDTIEIYPNPSTGMLSIRSGGTSILGVRVLNVLGEQVLSTEYRVPSDITLDLSKLPAGTYFAEIAASNGITIRKIDKEN